MRPRPNAVLAETHRAAVFASGLAPDAHQVGVGDRGWRSKWVERPGDGQPLFIVDDCSRVRDLAWAARHHQGQQLTLGFLRPRDVGPVVARDRERARSIGDRVGWTYVKTRQRGVLVFESAAERVTVPALTLGSHLLRLNQPSSLSVGVIGDRAAKLFGDWGGSWTLEPTWVGKVSEMVGGRLDLVFVDDEPACWDHDIVLAMMEEARHLGSCLVGIDNGSQHKVWVRLQPKIDLEITIGPDIDGHDTVGPGVDVRVVNPIGFARESDPLLAAVSTVPSLSPLPDGRWFDEESTRGLAVHLLDGADLMGRRLGDGRTDPQELIRRVRPFRAVVDHPRLHPGVVERARLVSWLTCAGVPVTAETVDVDLERLIGAETSELMRGTSLETLENVDRRERYSIELRRAALRDSSLGSRFRAVGARLGLVVSEAPSVSVVMATKRPEYLEHSIGQLNRQTYPGLEVVVALHGDGFPDGTESNLREMVPGSLEVVRVSDALNLGEALNVGISRSAGDLVTKWDDDDWYGPEHIWDLVLAMEYSGADAVGKAAEFVYLADLDITIRRFPDGAESPSRTLAGGTLTLTRETLGSIGGYPPLPRYVDQGLLARLADQGGTSFRTHGLGYVLNRHGEHTWIIETDYFLDASFRQWRGLRLDAAGVEVASAAHGSRSG